MNLAKLLESVLTQPTAPFRESWVKRAVSSYCHDRKIKLFEDDIGNLWVGPSTLNEARKSHLVFVAHLDHPGIVITGFTQKREKILAKGRWLGAGPSDIKNFPVKVFSDVNALIVLDGIVRKASKGPRGPGDVEIEIKSTPLAIAAATPLGLTALGTWGACLWYSKQGVPQGVKKSGPLWVTKAADDLAGACALLDAYAAAGKPRGVSLLLTRAEESGFHGTLAVLQKKWLDPKRTLMVSIETSSQLPGAELGKGPVVRLGDRATVFSPAFVYWVQSQAEALAKVDSSFKYQRRVMDGGTCEATAFNCFGFQVAGISIPLFNYHNITPKHARPEPEAVAAHDVEGVAKLACALMRNHRAGHVRTLSREAYKDFLGRLIQNQKSHARYFHGF